LGLKFQGKGPEYDEILRFTNEGVARTSSLIAQNSEADSPTLSTIEAKILQSADDDPIRIKYWDAVSDSVRADLDDAAASNLADSQNPTNIPIRQLLRAAGLHAEIVKQDDIMYIGLEVTKEVAQTRATQLARFRKRVGSDLGLDHLSALAALSALTVFEDNAATLTEKTRNFAAAALELDSIGSGCRCSISKHAVFVQGESTKTIGSSLAREIARCTIADALPNARKWVIDAVSDLYDSVSEDRPIDDYRLYYLSEGAAAGKNIKLADFLLLNESEFSGPRAEYYHAFARYLMMFLYDFGAGKGSALRSYIAHLELESSIIKRAVKDQQEPPELSVSWGWEAISEASDGKSPVVLETEFREYISNRDLAAVDKLWQSRRDSIRKYVRSM
jgi:hypothetical protein